MLPEVVRNFLSKTLQQWATPILFILHIRVIHYREIRQYFIFDTIWTKIWVRCITLITRSYVPLPCCVSSLSYSTKQGETTAAEISRTPGSGSLEVYTRSLASRSPLRSRVLSLPRLISISRARTLSSVTALAICFLCFAQKVPVSCAQAHTSTHKDVTNTYTFKSQIRINRLTYLNVSQRTYECITTFIWQVKS